MYSYRCSNGELWELDGCREGPVSHGKTTTHSFLQDVAGGVASGKCSSYSFHRVVEGVIEREFLQKSSSYQFNIMALVGGTGVLNESTPTSQGYPLHRTHSGIVQDLLGMGFPPDAVEFAVAASGGASVQAAMDLLMG